ncbi:tRNA (adenine-N1)-methyltransferase [Varibaculum vaginae]|uniref:tRNA (adenine-N1)-methyltransferase n=1 Tax=Varibaculum vaginae TaxID=2364797 RepID=UPI000F090FB0|nr:tRNA (adenine-N1)-methyltransferase [Varibaculum vaginae]
MIQEEAENLPQQPDADGKEIPGRRRGVFRVGDRVQLQGASGDLHTVTITEKGWFNTAKASFPLAELIGRTEGTLIATREGREFLAFRPRRVDYTLSMPRGAAIIYPKDAAQILQSADIFTGARVFECGAGSGALTISLLEMIGESGKLVSLEEREDFADIAQANADLWFGAPHPAWQLRRGSLGKIDLGSIYGNHYFDRAVIDLLDPWRYLDDLYKLLVPGGVLCCYITTVTQMSTLVEALRSDGRYGFTATEETIQRQWHTQGLALRPEHQMVGHTGFLITCRTLAPGAARPKKLGSAPKAAKVNGGQWNPEDNWEEVQLGQRNPSQRKTHRVRRDVVKRAEYWVRGNKAEASFAPPEPDSSLGAPS